MNAIKELWHGNIQPQEDSRTNTKEMKELIGYIARHHEELEKDFTDEQKEIFEKFQDCWGEYATLAGENKVAAAELSFENGAALHLVKYGFKADWTRDVNAAPEVYNLIAMGYCGTNAWWTLDNEGTLSILGSGVVINCTSKEAPWTAYKNEITKVVIGEGITKLGKSAFYEYANITEVVLPSTLTEIGHYAFYGCKGLTEVTIPASVTTIGSYVFRKSGVTAVIFESTEGWTYKGNTIDVTDAANVAYLMNKVSYSNVWSK